LASLRGLLVLVVASLFVACLAWEIYDPPGEEVDLLSFALEDFVAHTPGGAVSLGPCTIQVSAFIDPGRPGLAIKIKLLCTLSRPPPPATSLLYASNISCRISVAISSSEVLEDELPIGGLIIKAPSTPYQLLDERDVGDGGLSSASGIIDLALVAKLVERDGDILAEGRVEKKLFIPPNWALPLTVSMACAIAFSYWLYRRKAR